MSLNIKSNNFSCGSIAKKYPTFRDGNSLKSTSSFLKGKQIDDNAEGLWRIHDKLYDLSSFIENHPGGKDWISLTKGVDITEYFETHHLYGKAEQLLPKFYIRDAKLPRNYNFTFKPDGFYLTLKKKVMEALPKIDQSPKKISDFYSDLTLAAFFLFTILTAQYSSISLAIFTGCLINCQFIFSHNYFHRKDNFRMYGIHLSGADHKAWRIIHALSHHIYTNSYLDVEVTFMEPFLKCLPGPKTLRYKIFSILIVPIFYATVVPMSSIFGFISNFQGKEQFQARNLIFLITPTIMFLTSNSNLLIILMLWVIMLCTSSFILFIHAISGGHHHPNVYHEGDELSDKIDFGIYHLNAVIDHRNILMKTNNHFITIMTFRHHTLHHMFPTLDIALLKYLEPIFFKTCDDFNIEYRESSWWSLAVGNIKQLLRETPKLLKSKTC